MKKICLCILVSLTLLIIACNQDEEVRFYKTTKKSVDQKSNLPQSDGGLPAGHPPIGTMPTQDAHPLIWKAPQNWTKIASSFSMILASYQITGTEGPVQIKIFHFSGPAGGLLPNINRWRQQMSQAPIQESDIPTTTTNLKIAGYEGKLLDLQGNFMNRNMNMKPGELKKNYRMLAIYALTPQDALVVKMIGPDSEVVKHRQEFDQFCRSFGFRMKEKKEIHEKQ